MTSDHATREKGRYLERTLRVEMEAAGVDAIIGTSPENVQHLAGVFIVSQRMIPDRLAFAVYRRVGAPFFVVSTVVEYTARTRSSIEEVVPYTEHAVLPIDGLVQALKERALDRGRVWIEMGHLSARDADRMRAALPNLQILDAEGVLNRSRMIKVPGEIALMKRNARVWEDAVLDSYLSVQEGVSERSIADRMIHGLLDAGADWVPFISFASGPERTLIAHSVPDETVVRRGDIMRVDMVGFFRGYYTDFGRMAIIGGPSPAQRDAYRRLSALQKEMIARARPGVSASELYRESVVLGGDLGMDFSMDAIGHSLGLRLHEYPILNPFESQVLAKDMIMCIEISQAFDGLGRFHVEDLIRVTETGGERLTTRINTDEMLVVGE